MIILDLVCAAGHPFEGWFASNDAFEEQRSKDRINCPHCDSSTVTRLPAGAHIGKARKSGNLDSGKDSERVEALLEQLRQLGESSEDVGDRFPEEARRIHYRDADVRNIKGIATPSEMRELLEEGIPVLPVPTKKASH